MTDNPLVGRVVVDVMMAEAGGGIRFVLDTGETVDARADGDCCSHTWIEAAQGLDQIVGHRIVSVEDVDGVLPDSDDEELRYYGCKITSDAGYCLIDYRNESNGYYGGHMVWGDDYFYGGVFGQNGSMETLVPWREWVLKRGDD